MEEEWDYQREKKPDKSSSRRGRAGKGENCRCAGYQMKTEVSIIKGRGGNLRKRGGETCDVPNESSCRWRRRLRFMKGGKIGPRKKTVNHLERETRERKKKGRE